MLERDLPPKHSYSLSNTIESKHPFFSLKRLRSLISSHSFEEAAKYVKLFLIVFVGVVLWYAPHPEGITTQAWQLFSIFVATIIGIILKPFPMGAISLAGLCVIVLTKTIPFSRAFSGFSNNILWLIVFAFFVARGFIKTGIGMRISYFFMILMGKKTIGLGYGIILTDVLLSPAIPSATARSGGIIFPILKSLALAYDSTPHHPSSHRIGAYLTNVAFQASCITSGMFLTSMAANPLIAQIASTFGVHLSWGQWALATLVPGAISLILIPIIIFKLAPPGIKETPNATEYAKSKLKEMGPISFKEVIMLSTFTLLISLWIGGTSLGIDAAATALLGLVILIFSGVLQWKDILEESGAWETLLWFSVLFMMATELSTLGLTEWFGKWVVSQVEDFSWAGGFLIVSLIYFYSHFFFASNLAHVGALYASFLSVAIAIGTPTALAVLTLSSFSSLFAGISHYGGGPAAVMYGSGYVKIGTWWKIGNILALINIFIWMFFGSLWWKILGYW